jgi:hypothetical protein
MQLKQPKQKVKLLGSGKKSMKEYERNHRGHREKKISLSTPRLWQAGLCSQKKHKRQKMKITTAQRNHNKLIHRQQIRESLLGNTFEFTEGGREVNVW